MSKLKIDFDKLLGKPTKDYEIFHSKTKIATRKKGESLLKDMLGDNFNAVRNIKSDVSVTKALNNISFENRFSKNPLAIDQALNILKGSLGISYQGTPGVYLIPINSDIDMGIYHYDYLSAQLKKVRRITKTQAARLFDKSSLRSAVIVLFSSIIGDKVFLHGDRGYRYAVMEAGGLTQGIYIHASHFGISFSPVKFSISSLNKLINTNRANEMIVYALCLGNKKL